MGLLTGGPFGSLFALVLGHASFIFVLLSLSPFCLFVCLVFTCVCRSEVRFLGEFGVLVHPTLR